MKRSRNYRIALALAVLSAPVLAGCGSGRGNGVTGTGGGLGGWNNGYYWGNGTCVPINMPVGFSLNNVYADSANIVGGNFPYSGQAVGQVIVGQQGTLSGLPGAGMSMNPRTTFDGTLQLSLMTQNQQWTPYQSYPQYTFTQNQYYNNYGQNTKLAIGSGVMQISQQTQQEIYYRVQMGEIQLAGYNWNGNPYGGIPGGFNPWSQPGYGQPGYAVPGNYAMNQQICVSNIALNLGRWGNMLYGGKAYVYLNNTNHGIVLNF